MQRSRVVHKIAMYVKNYAFAGIEMRCDHLIWPDNKARYISMLSELKEVLSEVKTEEGCPKTVSIR